MIYSFKIIVFITEEEGDSDGSVDLADLPAEDQQRVAAMEGGAAALALALVAGCDDLGNGDDGGTGGDGPITQPDSGPPPQGISFKKAGEKVERLRVMNLVVLDDKIWVLGMDRLKKGLRVIAVRTAWIVEEHEGRRCRRNGKQKHDWQQ